MQKIDKVDLAQWHQEIEELDYACSTGRIGTIEAQKAKIDNLLDGARERKQQSRLDGEKCQ